MSVATITAMAVSQRGATNSPSLSRLAVNTTSGTTATFQVNVPVAPTLVNSREAVAGRLRVRVLEPANATINSNFSSGKYVEDGARYRIDVTGGTTGYVVELSEI